MSPRGARAKALGLRMFPGYDKILEERDGKLREYALHYLNALNDLLFSYFHRQHRDLCRYRDKHITRFSVGQYGVMKLEHRRQWLEEKCMEGGAPEVEKILKMEFVELQKVKSE